MSNTAGGQNASFVRMEYENLFALGPLCGIGDADTVLRASSLCDDLGLDTISTGATIAFARSARAVAVLSGRNHVLPEDIRNLAYRVLRNALILLALAFLSSNARNQSSITDQFPAVETAPAPQAPHRACLCPWLLPFLINCP
mgnify:CR=1 FL=1